MRWVTSNTVIHLWTSTQIEEYLRESTPQAVGMNFLEFASSFESVKTNDKVRLRGDPRKYAVRIWEKYSAMWKSMLQTVV